MTRMDNPHLPHHLFALSPSTVYWVILFTFDLFVESIFRFGSIPLSSSIPICFLCITKILLALSRRASSISCVLSYVSHSLHSFVSVFFFVAPLAQECCIAAFLYHDRFILCSVRLLAYCSCLIIALSCCIFAYMHKTRMVVVSGVFVPLLPPPLLCSCWSFIRLHYHHHHHYPRTNYLPFDNLFSFYF